MTAGSQGQGWWVASDGNWYPPSVQTYPPPVPVASSRGSEPTSERSHPLVPVAVVAITIIVGVSVAVGIVSIITGQSSDLTVSTSGPTYAATASDVQCSPSGNSVTVTGSLTGASRNPAYSGVSATVDDSSGNQIGSGEGPLLVLNDGQSQNFTITVPTNGTPASCHVTWGAGTPPGF